MGAGGCRSRTPRPAGPAPYRQASSSSGLEATGLEATGLVATGLEAAGLEAAPCRCFGSRGSQKEATVLAVKRESMRRTPQRCGRWPTAVSQLWSGWQGEADVHCRGSTGRFRPTVSRLWLSRPDPKATIRLLAVAASGRKSLREGQASNASSGKELVQAVPVASLGR
jgi:hypothetical protein